MGASKHLRGTRIVLAIAAATTVIATAAPFASADPIASASGSAFTALQPPFTEETFATSGSFLGVSHSRPTVMSGLMSAHPPAVRCTASLRLRPLARVGRPCTRRRWCLVMLGAA